MNTEPLCSSTKQTVLQNILFQEEYSILEMECRKKNISLTALKGISFLGRIYSVAERSMTDIDIYISPESHDSVRKILLNMGYLERVEAKWEFNYFKSLYVKYHLGLEIVFEVHTQLLPNRALDHWQTIPFKNSNILEPVDEILYLAYHYAHQHTLLHPKWLHDIYKLSEQTPELWNSEIWLRAKSKQIHSALLLTALSLNCKYQLNIETPHSAKKYFVGSLINKEFLETAEKHPKKYYVAKHLAKDSLWKAFSYDIKWIVFQFKNRFLNKTKSSAW